MTHRQWPVVTMVLCFVCLSSYIFVNDLNYRIDNSHQNLQVKTYQTYSYWYRYISTIKGLILTTNGFGETLEAATDLQKRTESLLAELTEQSGPLDSRLKGSVEAFASGIKASLRLGKDLTDNGYLFLAQPDLPLIYREGRVGLSSLSGKDVTTLMGTLSSYQYYQLIRRLKGMNTLFDRLYSDRLEEILRGINDRSDDIRRNFFILRLALLGLTIIAFTVLVVRLIRLNRFLRKVALRTGQELATTRSHLSEVQLYLHSAQFQQSLFEMVAGLSHELNTPLGNCVSASSYLEVRIDELKKSFEQGSLSKEGFSKAVSESEEGFSLMRANLERMRIQIETFKRLSGVNLETHGSVIPLDRFIDEELPRLIREWGGTVEYAVMWDRLGKAEIRYTDLEILLQQLFDNCREHAKATHATIAFKLHEGFLDISFADNGKGINDQALEKIAEPFFTTARGKNHMGLGLSILSSFVINKLQGTISFHHGNPGLRVAMSLPIRNLS